MDELVHYVIDGFTTQYGTTPRAKSIIADRLFVNDNGVPEPAEADPDNSIEEMGADGRPLHFSSKVPKIL